MTEAYRLVPSLLAKNLDDTARFYERLGFAVTGRYPKGKSPSWLELSLGGVTLQFYSNPPANTLTRPALSGTLYIEHHDVDALAIELAGTVDVAWGPQTMDYAMREFAIRDPNGYVLAFTMPA